MEELKRKGWSVAVKAKMAAHRDDGVEQFLAKHSGDVTGIISEPDRLRLRASLRRLYQPSLMRRHLSEARAHGGVLLLSPDISYADFTGPPPARSPTTKTVGPACRADSDHAASPAGPNTIRITGAHLPPSFVTGIFNRSRVMAAAIQSSRN